MFSSILMYLLSLYVLTGLSSRKYVSESVRFPVQSLAVYSFFLIMIKKTSLFI